MTTVSWEVRYFQQDFPFNEIRNETGDYFASVTEAINAGYQKSQIWSVADSEGAYTYGPSHHYVNVIGYVATTEHHDDNTYYEELLDHDN